MKIMFTQQSPALHDHQSSKYTITVLKLHQKYTIAVSKLHQKKTISVSKTTPEVHTHCIKTKPEVHNHCIKTTPEEHDQCKKKNYTRRTRSPYQHCFRAQGLCQTEAEGGAMQYVVYSAM